MVRAAREATNFLMHQSFETPAPPPPPIRAWAGHSLFMQVKVSEVPGPRGQKWVVHSPAPTHWLKNTVGSHEKKEKQIDFWATSK